MNPQADPRDNDRKGFLLGAAAGYTCLACSLLVFVTEGSFVKAGWIAERTATTIAFMFTAILFLFPASLAYARIQAKRSAEGSEPPESFNRRKLILKTVLWTLALALLVEAFAVSFEAIEHMSNKGNAGRRGTDLYANQDYARYVGVAAIDPKWATHVQGLLEDNGIPNVVEGAVAYGVSVPPGEKERAVKLLRADAARHGYWARF
jgi:hypothetical protein